jgi:hypothetical protein
MGENNSIKVDHPEFGHVIFNYITPRQLDVLDSLKDRCTIADDVIAQNKMLADIILDRDREVKKLKQEIFNLKNPGESPYIDLLI